MDKKSDVNTARDSDKTKKERSPSSKSKSDSKKSSSSSKSSGSKPSSGGKSGSKSLVKGKDDKDSRKRARENESSPGSPEKEGRISPLPQPDHSLGRIPKVKRGNNVKSEEKRGSKRAGFQRVSPVPEKKPKPLFIE